MLKNNTTNIGYHTGKANNNNEFYTQMKDIEKELAHYKDCFKDKIVYCNCDDPYESEFFKYFVIHFNSYKLKKLICISFAISQKSGTQLYFKDIMGLKKEIKKGKKEIAYKVEIDKLEDLNLDGRLSLSDIRLLLKKNPHVVTPLKGNGDFRSQECIDILKTVDIVVTNPPFKNFRNYVKQLINYNKKFLIIGSYLAITYKWMWNLFKDKKIWKGYNEPCFFIRPDKSIDHIPAYWYTNLKEIEPNEKKTLKPEKRYTPEKFPKYLNYNAINCDFVRNMPEKYDGEIGVPSGIFEYDFEKDYEFIGVYWELPKTRNIKLRVRKTGKITNSGSGPEFFLESDEDGPKMNYINIENGKFVRKLACRFVIRRKRKK